MKKRLLKLLSVLMAFVVVFASAAPAFAKNKVTPVIVVHGLGGSDLYTDAANDKTKIPQFGIDLQAMAKNQTILDEAIKLFTDQRTPDYDKLLTELGDYFKSTGLNYDENGNPVGNSGVNCYWEDSLENHKSYMTMRTFSIPVMSRQIAKIIGAKNVYAFNYDWRADACVNAKKLRGLVKAVKKQTGSKKVTIVALSLGGSVMSAYMDAYKNKKDVERYILVNPAYQGVDVARAFDMDLSFNGKAVVSYLKKMETSYQAGEQQSLFRAITALGDQRIITGLNKLNKDVIKKDDMRAKFFNNLVKPWIGNIPAFYELIPYKNFNSACDKLASIGYLDKNSELYKKVKNYHKIQGRFAKNLKAVKKSGAQVAIIANYGTPGLPITSKKTNQTDLLIDTKYASVGATVAKFGKKLSKKKSKGKYASPDRIINAKTCALPDNTWFITGVIHGLYKYNSDANKFIANLSTGRVKCNLKAVKKKYGYSQFLKADQKQNLKNVKK